MCPLKTLFDSYFENQRSALWLIPAVHQMVLLYACLVGARDCFRLGPRRLDRVLCLFTKSSVVFSFCVFLVECDVSIFQLSSLNTN